MGEVLITFSEPACSGPFGLRDDVARTSRTVANDIALADEVVAVIRRRRAESVRRPSSSSSRDATPSR